MEITVEVGKNLMVSCTPIYIICSVSQDIYYLVYLSGGKTNSKHCLEFSFEAKCKKSEKNRFKNALIVTTPVLLLGILLVSIEWNIQCAIPTCL